MERIIPRQTPALTILLTGEQVDGIIFALEHSHTWAWDTTPEHLTTRRLLLERLREHANPAEMTVAQILEREA